MFDIQKAVRVSKNTIEPCVPENGTYGVGWREQQISGPSVTRWEQFQEPVLYGPQINVHIRSAVTVFTIATRPVNTFGSFTDSQGPQ